MQAFTLTGAATDPVTRRHPPLHPGSRIYRRRHRSVATDEETMLETPARPIDIEALAAERDCCR